MSFGFQNHLYQRKISCYMLTELRLFSKGKARKAESSEVRKDRWWAVSRLRITDYMKSIDVTTHVYALNQFMRVTRLKA